MSDDHQDDDLAPTATDREERRGRDERDAPTVRERTGPFQFLREVRAELRKVAWPSRKELLSYTIVVLSMTTVLTLVVWGFDEVIRRALINTFQLG